MSLQFVNLGETFTVRTYKLTGDYAWANTYEITAREEAESNNQQFWRVVADLFVLLERSIHLTFVQIDRVVISTYVPDGQPYNPTSFLSFPSGIFGQVTPMEAVLPADACIYVRRDAVFGRDGRLLYRGCLHEGLVTGGFPRHSLEETWRSQVQGVFNNWYSAFRGQTVFDVTLVTGVPLPTSVREVVGFTVEPRIVYKKPRNRYFDRVRQP